MQNPRSDVVGSLLRPDYLKEARLRLASGALRAAEFKAIEDRAVDDAVALQTRSGVGVLTDGEMRRYAFFGNLVESVEGFDREGGWTGTFHDEAGGKIEFKRPAVVGRLRLKRHQSAEEFAYLRARTDRPKKVTLVSAQQAAAFYHPEKSRAAYPTLEAYVADAVDILRSEVAELARLGCTYIQVDAPQYAGLIDPEWREGYRRRGIDPDRMLDLAIEMDNALIAGHPGVTFGLHVCRGNNQSKYFGRGDYAPIAKKLFAGTRFQRFLLEYDDERSGDFEPLRFVPEDRTVVLGLVTTKHGRLEERRALAARIREAARLVPLERLALSPQCGFASTFEGNLLSPQEQEAKLRRVAETAAEIWSRG
jgi:5-methyltetrahydropteroyltriglutamate--homocysteine methyltransferase